MAFTEKFSKPRGKSKKIHKYAKGGLVDEDGNEPSNNFRTLRTEEGWQEERRNKLKREEDYAVSSDGASGRSMADHAKAIGRAIFEPKEWRSIYEEGGKRDRANPLYDRKKSKGEYE